ncbi:MAG: hypothetical protein KG012_06645 [Deltaproteobacteria bacterium]|nr:hypothetical protein [Deltaproteobacteria bacterium]
MFRKFFILSALGLIFVLALNGCGKKTEVAEGPKIEEITVALTPSTQEIKGEQFTLQLSNLRISKTINKSTKELTTTPNLKGNIKITNQSKNILDVQGVTIEYLDNSGNPIPFKTGEKKVTVSTYWTDLQPGKEAENYLDVTVPMAAVKEKSLDKIQLSVVYIPSPLKREALEIQVKMEEK